MPPCLRLGLFPPKHRTLECRVGCFSLEVLRLHENTHVIKLIDFLVNGAVASGAVAEGGVALLVDTVRGDSLKWPAGR
jgi:hypothetical protein